MTTWQLKTPVAFIIFNRPETTAKVFDAIRQARPPKILVIADGPRVGRQGEDEMCRASRAIIDSIDWPCEVLKNYSERNMGCKQRVSSGLDWVFDNVEEAIILEDDCLPHPTFFRFCEELLNHYRTSENIMMISGDNFQLGKRHGDASYYFSRITHIWGWASWRRAWKHFDVQMQKWPDIRDANVLQTWFADKKAVKYWQAIFENVYKGKINSWAYPWYFACRVNNGLAILPQVNLVSNMGYGTQATHTGQGSIFADMKVEPALFPLLHPQQVSVDKGADDYTEKLMFSGRSILSKITDMLKRYLA